MSHRQLLLREGKPPHRKRPTPFPDHPPHYLTEGSSVKCKFSSDQCQPRNKTKTRSRYFHLIHLPRVWMCISQSSTSFFEPFLLILCLHFPLSLFFFCSCLRAKRRAAPSASLSSTLKVHADVEQRKNVHFISRLLNISAPFSHYKSS